MGSIFVDDYPANFTFFDKLSIELQTKTYDEINPEDEPRPYAV